MTYWGPEAKLNIIFQLVLRRIYKVNSLCQCYFLMIMSTGFIAATKQNRAQAVEQNPETTKGNNHKYVIIVVERMGSL